MEQSKNIVAETITEVTAPYSPFAEIAGMAGHLRRQKNYVSPVAAELLKSGAALQRVHEWAAEMQLGAEGYDNTESAGRYHDVQEHLFAAAQEIAKACKALQK